MTKYYFISYQGKYDDGDTEIGSCVMEVEDTSLSEIERAIEWNHDCLSVVILSLKDLTEEEYKMLSGEK